MHERLRRWGVRLWEGVLAVIKFLERVADCQRAKILFSVGGHTYYGQIVERIGEQYRVKVFSIGSHPMFISEQGGFFAQVPVNSPLIRRIWRWE